MKATVFALALLWAGALCAQTPTAPPRNAAAHLDKLATLLDLTDAQKAQVQAVLEAEHAKIRAAHEQAKASGTKPDWEQIDRKSTRLNSSHGYISYAVFCLKKKTAH